ncbi:GGDEF domain-containing protein [Deinococcus sp.]|uniref:GGDEF domain-containing protein n=1 Tax=Deinococcus sp. TaxID=47478 RepID=UPI003B5BED48
MTESAAAKLARYRLLLDIAARLVSLHQADDVLSALHTHIGKLFSVPVTLLALKQPEGSWECLTLEGQNTHLRMLPPQPDGLLERALRGELSYTNDVLAYALEHRLPLRRLDPASALPLTHSWMGVPLEIEGQSAGVLSIQSYTRGEFTGDDLEFLRLLGNHLGIALENAVLRQRLEHEARTDALTHLGNRRSFIASGEQAMRVSGPLCLAVLDVQNFKGINDAFGHPTGDAVLALIGQLLARCAAGKDGETSGQAFRLGGDEFALLLPATPDQAYARISAMLQEAAHAPWPAAVPVRLDIGLAECQPGQEFAALVREADGRMYEAKRNQA